MKTIDYLEKQNTHAFDMVKFGENKNTMLIGFNVVIIIGMWILARETENMTWYYFITYVISMCCISIFISMTALIAKIKHSTNNVELTNNDNILFFGTMANMTADELVDRIKTHYECESSNINHERDLAKRAIITSQIAARKFRLFNIAIAFSFSGILTPLILLVYKLFFSTSK